MNAVDASGGLRFAPCLQHNPPRFAAASFDLSSVFNAYTKLIRLDIYVPKTDQLGMVLVIVRSFILPKGSSESSV